MASQTCGACGGTALQPRDRIDYYIQGGSIETDLVRCGHCRTWSRVLDASAPDAVTHFNAASYTDQSNEERLWESRKDFFRFLFRLCERELPPPAGNRLLLDFGCSFGHMMDVFRAEGYETTGVEIVGLLRDHLRRKGHLVYPSLPDIPAGERFDVVAFVDSLYYADQPVVMLSQARERLKKHGVLLLRVTNRAPVLEIFHRLHRPITSAVFVDGKFSFSAKGIRAACERAGFRVARTVLLERGKHINGPVKSLYYRLAPCISRLTGCVLTPGIILLCTKR